MARGQPRGATSRRRLLLRIGVPVVLLGAVGVAIADLIPGSARRLDDATAAWIVAAVAAEAVACLSYADLFHAVFSAGRWRVAPLRSAQIALGELAAFVVVPTGAGGPALRIWALMTGRMPFGVIIERSVVHAALLNIPVALAAAVLGLTVALGLGPAHTSTLIALTPAALAVGATALTLLLARYVRTQGPAPRTGWRRFSHEAAESLPGGIRQIPAGLRSPRRILGGLGYWTGDCGVLVLAFAALGGSPPLEVIVLAYMLGQLGNALPLPGGIGGVEPLMLGVLSSSGVDLALGGAAVLLYRIVSLGLQTGLGTLAVLALVPALTPAGADAGAPASADAGPGRPAAPASAEAGPGQPAAPPSAEAGPGTPSVPEARRHWR